jgi:transcriptional regulator with XRE-family HTH domain
MKILIDRAKELKGARSVSSFAIHIGMSQQTVDNYLSLRQKPSLAFLYHICCSCQVSADYLLGFTDNRYGANISQHSPEVKAMLAEKDTEIKRLNGVIDGLRMALNTLNAPRS